MNSLEKEFREEKIIYFVQYKVNSATEALIEVSMTKILTQKLLEH